MSWCGGSASRSTRTKGSRGRPWWADSSIHTESINAGDGTTVIAGARWGDEGSVFESDEDAAHIAAHDPARVLREVEAKRQMIQVAPVAAEAVDSEHGCCHRADEILTGECPNFPPSGLRVLQLLALPYADRPGYQESWRP